MYYEEIFKALAENKIRYVVAGGMAANLHGVPRATMDLDVVLALDPPYQQIDVLFDTPIPFEVLYEKSQPLVIAGVSVPLASIEDLKEMKRYAGREQDLADIEMLERVEKPKQNQREE